MAELDPRAIVPENHKTIRKLDGSLGVAKLQQVETKASKEFTPILKAVVELVKCYQTDTNVEEDLRVKNLADLILDRHTAMLNTMTKDADTWAKVKWYIEAKVGELVLQYSVDNSNSAKDDVKVVTKKINDAITKALIEWNKKNKPKLTSTEEKRIEVIELDKEVVNKKTDKLMQSKEYKRFLGELKSDFEGFVKDYDANRKILITNYKKAIDNNIIKTNKPKQNILTKLTDIFKDKPITKKDRQPKKSLNPFRSFDIKGLAKTVSVGVIGFVGASAGLIGKFFKGKVFLLAAKLMKNVVYGAIGTMAGMLNGFLNMFGRGPFGMIMSLVLFPIKLIASGLMLVIKPLVKLIKGLANIILAPIKILVLGPIKLLKKFGSFVTGIFSGLLSFLNKRTILSLFKIFLTTGGAFMLGYIVGKVWMWIMPFYLKISSWIDSGAKYIAKIHDFINDDKNDSYFKRMFDKENTFLPGTFSYKLHDIILTGYTIFEEVSSMCGIALTNVKSFFNGVFDWFMTSSPALNTIMKLIVSKPFLLLMTIVMALRRGLLGPIATVFKNCQGIIKLVGIGLAVGVEAVRRFFKFWSRDSEDKPELENAFKEGVKAKSEKQLAAIGIVGENADQYADLYNGVNNELNDIPELSKLLNELKDISEKTNGNLSEYPEFIQKVITSYALGSKNPETFAIAPNFAKFDLQNQYQLLYNILEKRKDRAGQLGGIISAGNKKQILQLLDTVKNRPLELSISIARVKDENGKSKKVNFKNTLAKIEEDGNTPNSGLKIGKNLTLKAMKGGSLTIDKRNLTRELLEAMRESGIVTDESRIFGNSVTIDISPDKLAAYKQKYAEKRQLSILNTFTTLNYAGFNNGNAVSAGQKVQINQALADYFKSNDVTNLTDKDIRRDLGLITEGILKGQKVNLTHGKINVKEEFLLVEQKAQAASEVLAKVENGQNTVVVTTSNNSQNPAAEEANRQQ